jgi:hypothetical protein
MCSSMENPASIQSQINLRHALSLNQWSTSESLSCAFREGRGRRSCLFVLDSIPLVAWSDVSGGWSVYLCR